MGYTKVGEITQCAIETLVCQKETVINEVKCLAMQSLYTSASNKEREIKLHVIRQRVSA